MELPICALAFVIFSVWFPAIGGNIVTLSPSPEAKVTEGDNLKLQCDFSGSYTPDTVNWYLNNDTLGYVLLATDCSEASVPPLYGSGRYNKTCSIPSFSLQIQNVTISMDGDIWSCDTTSIGNSPPSKVSTRIKVNKRTTTSTQPPGSGNCQLVLILCLVIVLIIAVVFIIIIIVILICTDDEHAYTLGLVVGISFGITLIVCCIIIAILISTGTTQCKLELGLALVLLLGIICIIICIIALIFRCSSIPQNKGKPKRVKFGEGIHRGFLYSTGIGFIVVYFVCTKDEDNQEESDELHPVETCETCVGTDANFSFTVTEDCKESEVVIKNESGGIVMTVHGKKVKSDDSLYKDRVTFTGDMKQMQISFILRNVTLEDAGIYLAVLTNPVKTIGRLKLIVKALKKSKTNNSGPPAFHTGTQNKVEPGAISNPTYDRQQPMTPIRPQPVPEQNGEINDRSRRGISATLEDMQGLASDTPRPARLLPLPPKQETIQNKDASKERKKKGKKNKKKDQINEETPEEENGKTNLSVN